MKKLVFNAGFNDLAEPTACIQDGHQLMCVYYATWKSILRRVYDEQFKKCNPTYADVTLCREWHSRTAFTDWMKTQNHIGLQLDKDLLVPGNKHYSPDTCVFIPHSMNSLLTTCQASRGKYPIGVMKHTNVNKFVARIYHNKKYTHLGIFDTPEEASQAYNKAKSDHILEIAAEQTDERIANGLRLHAQLYLEGKVK